MKSWSPKMNGSVPRGSRCHFHSLLVPCNSMRFQLLYQVTHRQLQWLHARSFCALMTILCSNLFNHSLYFVLFPCFLPSALWLLNVCIVMITNAFSDKKRFLHFSFITKANELVFRLHHFLEPTASNYSIIRDLQPNLLEILLCWCSGTSVACLNHVGELRSLAVS